MRRREVFCEVDDFWQETGREWERTLMHSGGKQHDDERERYLGEIMALPVHQACYRTFTDVQVALRREVPQVLRYRRMVEIISDDLVPLTRSVQSKRGTCTGIRCSDSTALADCKNPRISSQRVFRGRATRGKTSTGWFYGGKRHLVVNDQGELLAFCLTPGNGADRHPVPTLPKRLVGTLRGDTGCIWQALFAHLVWGHGLHLITRVRKPLANRLMPLLDKVLVHKRAVIASHHDHLKQIRQIEHSRHRSPINFLVNLLGGWIAYCWPPSQPSLSREICLDLAF
jgi:hypothetical protein